MCVCVTVLRVKWGHVQRDEDKIMPGFPLTSYTHYAFQFQSRVIFFSGTAGKNTGRTNKQIQIDIQHVSSVELGVSQKIYLQPGNPDN